jgi:[ribosomal protein S5]-alanine N-acetyltransferase
MRLLNRDGSEIINPRLLGESVVLRLPEPRDYLEWSELRRISRGGLEPFEPAWAEDELSRDAFKRRLRRYAEDVRDGTAYPFFIHALGEDDQLVGGVTLSNVRRGVAQMCSVGYWCGMPYRRRGYTREAVSLAIGFAFETLGLHRVEAACLPDNLASRQLLEGIGFQLEGQAHAYLKIASRWRDHALYGLVRND